MVFAHYAINKAAHSPHTRHDFAWFNEEEMQREKIDTWDGMPGR